MSDTILKLIPTTPEYIPDQQARLKAMDILASLYRGTNEVREQITEDVEFVDQGENWSQVQCPYCGKELDVSWWQEAMDASYVHHFADLSIIVPCCKKSSSLNDLRYVWSAGFARFVLEVENPVTSPTSETIQTLEQILSCELRLIWARY